MNRVTRRDLLAASAAGVGIATAGCTGSGDNGDDSGDGGDSSDAEDGGETDAGDEPANGTAGDTNDGAETDGGDETEQPTRTGLPALQYVRVENDHDQSHSAHVLVENAGEIVHWSSHEVGGGDAVTLDRNWTAERGEFVVSVRIDDQTSWTQIDLTKERPNCYGVIPRITESGEIKRLWERNPEGCGETPEGASTSD